MLYYFKSKLASRALVKTLAISSSPIRSIKFNGFQAVNTGTLPSAALLHEDKTAIIDNKGIHSYKKLFFLSCKLRDLVQSTFPSIANGDRIAFLTSNNAMYTLCQWSVWLTGAIGVPLCPQYPSSELSYVLENSQSSLVISSCEHYDTVDLLAKNLKLHHLPLPQNFLSEEYVQSGSSDDEVIEKSGLIIYTSGTTGRPKGVVHTHSSLNAQVQGIAEKYKINSSDVLLHVLPLHHVHGIVNMLMCPLTHGATVVMEEKFNPENVWNHLLQDTKPQVNVFMAVPTIYTKLIEYFDKNNLSVEETVEKCKNIRLMISGSSALPVSVLNKWREITGHVLLERYGMTEIGMALTNPYDGNRQPGAVGLPFPRVNVQIVPPNSDGSIDLENRVVLADEKKVVVTPGREEAQGELLVKSPNMFDRYFNNSKATKESFIDGWFRTGDTAVYKDGTFRIVGRTSVDIIKSGGYKISALDVEQHLLNHPSIREVSVVGVPDPLWGEVVSAILSFHEGSEVPISSLKSWCREEMASYHIPKNFKVLEQLPRNVMGKVNKKQLLKTHF